ncbi:MULTISPECIES: zinc ribbon domain-containing protein [unclassified Variovorax]|uniref:zinc ribbon domain-containing protein n=1 Tax=unclassified Variovorax TaxID=663243 RepID=UPI00083939BC|nr:MULTISPECIES: zinc ribbon domain-containing protein [unclassified Variovorax]PNG59352.1 hypothetical protein CHC07_01079 [Variovorax sp. B4]PNG60857.1 hypothetical protein CHC06_00756 [Variovorax sp. B2]VTV13221.1 hypothetical protein WDL1CHR_03908 [Variovorax sp. WDL1]
MPVVCTACGSNNRENAKFCIGCARRLPGFVPTGPSALEAINNAQPPRAPVRTPRRAWRRDDPLTLLPAETAGFWLRLALLGLAMGIGFIGWYLYVTRQLTQPAFLDPITAALAVEDRKPPADESVALAAPSASTAPAPAPAGTAAPTAPAVPPKASGQAQAPAPARAAQPEAAPQASTKAQPPAAKTEPVLAKSEPAAAAAYRAPSVAPADRHRDSAQSWPRRSRAPAWADDEPPTVPLAIVPATVSPSPARAPAWSRDDPGPPIAPGPGPVFSATRSPSWNRGDGGPPVVPGPGPVVTPSRSSSPVVASDGGPPIVPGPGPVFSPVRTPTWAANDPGPPIAIGPGPVYNRTREP